MVHEIDDSKLYRQSTQFLPDTICHPMWTLGHLITSTMGMREEMHEILDPSIDDFRQWTEKYGQHSDPISDPSFYHRKDELIAVLESQVNAAEKTLRALTDEQLSGPMPDKRYRHIYPSLFHVCASIFIMHSAEHVKMLSVWKYYVESIP
ncbi:MAG TPA: hypothetical protein ENN69_03145 [Spirochaetia bacterium]|nr:hypothetical protein [Spirochaetia bacterium]